MLDIPIFLWDIHLSYTHQARDQILTYCYPLSSVRDPDATELMLAPDQRPCVTIVHTGMRECVAVDGCPKHMDSVLLATVLTRSRPADGRVSGREQNGAVFSKVTRNENHQHCLNRCQVCFQERDVLDDADTKAKRTLLS